MKYIVYDDRTGKTLFENRHKYLCIDYIDRYLELFKNDFGHIWLKEIK